ncbi:MULTISPECIES: DUF6602 domain-containing protein [unclassified Rhizobium]|uniref:DUF6602 domain-containing protein n=1 Tax=unclassified Rhizobium TaxID=2613769 RepID=UPI00288AC157|nr:MULTISPECIES: DUF6602 domain-containing protein [unclassified Rhizobium]
MKTILYDYCQYSLKRLHASFDATKVLDHGSSLGSIREQLITDFLVDHLPSVSRIVSGQVFDAQDQRSTQQDVIITLSNVPRLPFASGVDLVFAEGVIATLEIKSRLNGPTLKQIGNGISSVRALRPNIWGHTSTNVSHTWPGSRILSGVLTYGGSSLSSLHEVLKTMASDTQPDFVLDLSAGMLIKNEGLLLGKSGVEDFITIDDPARALMMFLTFLTEITSTLAGRGINWRGYWK